MEQDNSGLLATMVEESTLFRTQSLPYLCLDGDALQKCGDLRVYATDQTFVKLPSVMLASLSPLLKEMLTDAHMYAEGIPTITTEIEKEDLATILNFVALGVMPNEISNSIAASFQNLGINLSDIKLTQEPSNSIALPFTSDSFIENEPMLPDPSDDFSDEEENSKPVVKRRRRKRKQSPMDYVEAVFEPVRIKKDYESDFIDDSYADQEDYYGGYGGNGYEEDFGDDDLVPESLRSVKKRRRRTNNPSVVTPRKKVVMIDNTPETEEEAAREEALIEKRLEELRIKGIVYHQGLMPGERPKPDYGYVCLTAKQLCAPWNDFPDKRAKDELDDQNRPIDGRNTQKCAECGFLTFSKEMMEQHYIHHRVVDRKLDIDYFYCTTMACLKQFGSQNDWKDHCKAQHGGKLYQCFYCDKSYSRVNRRKEHEDLAHNRTDMDEQPALLICPHCGVEFSNAMTFRKHKLYESTYHGTKCVYGVCDFEFETFPEHDAHIKKQHAGQMLLVCGFCPETFDQKTEKRKHRFSAHPEFMNKFYKQCDICGKHVNAIVRHKALEHDMDEPGFCKICNQEFAEFRKHQVSVHYDVASAPCSRCGKMVRTSLMNSHICVSLSADSDYATKADLENRKCLICSATFNSLLGIKNHVRLAHQDKREPTGEIFPCKKCDKTYTSLRYLRCHDTVVHPSMDRKEYPCPHCPKILNTVTARHFHVKNIHRLPFNCKVCKKRYESQELLNQHIISGENCIPAAKTKRPCAECKVCGKVIGIKVMAFHMLNIHTPDSEKPYRCPHCPKGFARERNFMEHVNTHTNDRPFKCTECDAAFNSSCSLSSHEIKAHNRQRRIRRPNEGMMPIPINPVNPV